MSAENTKFSWQSIAWRTIGSTATHPLELAKFLIQIGHEPVAPYPSSTLLGRPALALPNAFQYLKHIRRVDGFTGCYRGLGLKLMSTSVQIYAYHCTAEVLKAYDIFQPERNGEETTKEQEDETEDDEDSDDDGGLYEENVSLEEKHKRFYKLLANKLTCTTVSIVISQPFYVATCRAMAQFVGKETRYAGCFSAIIGVYKENGILGYFSGIVPRWLGEAVTLTLGATLTFLVRTYLVRDRTLGNMLSLIMKFVASTTAYPFYVVSSCMAIKGSTLKAALPPAMPSYPTWVACFTYLKADGQLMRGSSMLWRYYNGPKFQLGNRLIPIEKM